MAGTELGTGYFQLLPSARGLKKNLEKELGAAGQTAGDKFSSEFDTAASKGKGIEDVANKALVFSAAVGAGLFGIASAAGNLDAAVAANIQVLGDASDAVQDFAENGVEAVGLSETAILDASTAFGQLGKIIGLSGDDLSTFSTDFVTLASDMAAFKNVSPEQALRDLQAGFAGSTEVLRKYGIFLDEAGLKQAFFDETGQRVTGTLTAQQRIVATASEVWRQSADIQGQAAREADSFERSIADLKATAGNIAADFGAPIVGFAGDLIGLVGDGLTQLSDWNDELGGMLGTGLAAGIGIAAAAAGTIGVAGKIKALIGTPGGGGFRGMTRAMQRATVGVGLLALGVTAGFAIYGLLTKRSREVAARTSEVAGALDQATTDAWEYAEAAAGADGAIDGFAVAQRALGDALTESNDDLVQNLGALGLQTDDVLPALLAFGEGPVEGFRNLATEAGFVGDEIDAMALIAEHGMGIIAATTPGDLAALDQLAGQLGVSREAARDFARENLAAAIAMGNVREEAELTELDDIAAQYLNKAVAVSEDAEALIEQAEAQAEATRNGDDAFDVYLALQDILAQLPPAERDAAQEALGLADAQSEVARETEAANLVQASAIEVMSQAERQASELERRIEDLNDALTGQVNPILDANEANRQYQEGQEELNAAIKEGTTELFENTQEGRDNQRMIEDQVTNILDMAQAGLRNGESVEFVTGQVERQRKGLIRQLVAFGLSETAAANYVNQLGLTPEVVTTSIDLAGVEEQKRRIDDYLTDLGEIPEHSATRIQALIDQGAFDFAEERLRQLTAARDIRLRANVEVGYVAPSLISTGAFGNAAFGAYVEGDNRGSFWRVGERSWDEAILTVGHPANLKRQLQDERIGGPILDALPTVELGSMRSPGRDMPPVVIKHYGQTVDPASVSAAWRMARFQR